MGIFQGKEWSWAGLNVHTFRFSGKDSPWFYAISLEKRIRHLCWQYTLAWKQRNIFSPHQCPTQGVLRLPECETHHSSICGNVMPSIKDAQMAANFGDYMRYQLSIIRKLAPNASILFIGPSDMSVKRGTDYVTTFFWRKRETQLKKRPLITTAPFWYVRLYGRTQQHAAVGGSEAGSYRLHTPPVLRAQEKLPLCSTQH